MGNIIPIPSTLARLQPYIDIYAVRGGVSIEDAARGIVSGEEKRIGTIDSIDIKIERNTEIWREFNSERAGLPKEVYPTLPTYELTLNKVMLHKLPADLDASGQTHDNLMATFGFNQWQGGFDVVAQYRPLMIKVQLLSPRDTNGNVIPNYPGIGTLLFYDVWLDASSMTFGLDGTDLVVKQPVSGKAAGVFFS